MSKALITGVSGSGGSYLAEYLLNHTGCEVYGLARWHSTGTHKNIRNLNIHTAECDLTDLSSVIRCFRSIKPDYIFNLAAHANVHASFTNPLAVLQNNVSSMANILEAISILGLDTKLLQASTSELYGNVKKEDTPIKEDHPTNPVNVYAVSKLTQEKLCLAYYKMYGVPVILTRMFSYINPRRADLFSTAFAHQVVKIEQGLLDRLRHGNLQSVRTLIDVRDAISAYWYAIHDCQIGEVYNIGGDNIVTVERFLELLKEKARVPIISELDPNLVRPVDVTLQIPDVTKFHSVSEWRPKYTLDESIEHLLGELRC